MTVTKERIYDYIDALGLGKLLEISRILSEGE